MGDEAGTNFLNSRVNGYQMGFTYKEYSHIELSKVSAPVFCKEHTLLGFVSILLHVRGSWNPNVLFKYRGWKKPVKPVLVLLMNEV